MTAVNAPALKNIFALVEEHTGYPVAVTPDPDQTTHIAMRSAGLGAPVHAIFPNPKYERYVEYLIATQCATLLFKWTNKQEVWDFVVLDAKAAYQKGKIANRMIKKGMSPAASNQYANAIFSGIMNQLNSTPLEILSVQWCYQHYPVFREAQEEYVEMYLREMSGSLSTKVRELAPPDIFEKNASMNAAYAANWAGLASSPLAMLPYETLGFSGKGQELLSRLTVLEGQSAIYKHAVDAWACSLHMSGWYEWRQRAI